MLLIVKRLSSKKIIHVVFVGPKGSGKTSAMYKICQDRVVETVHTHRQHSMMSRGLIFTEKPELDGETDPLVKYGIDSKLKEKYFFFINSSQDILDIPDLGVKYTYRGTVNDLGITREKVICLEGDYTRILEYI